MEFWIFAGRAQRAPPWRGCDACAASARRITSDNRFEKAAGSGSGSPPTMRAQSSKSQAASLAP